MLALFLLYKIILFM